MRMRAAILNACGVDRPYQETKPLEIGEVEVEGPGPGEVLVKVEAAGLCHSDLSVIDGNRPRPTPMVLGHEAAGRVVEIGAGVGDLAVDDQVALVFAPSCGTCLPCASGRPSICEPGAKANGAGSLLGDVRRLSRGGAPVHHHVGVSAFAEYAVLHRGSLVKLDPELPPEIAALFGCAVVTGAGAVINTAQFRPGATAAVVGLGGVGLCSVLGARAAGARRIVAVDLNPEKLALAREVGATDTVLASDPDAVAQVKEITGGGAEYAFEMAGSARALELAYALTGRGGTTVTAGLPHPDARMDLSPLSLVAEERTLKGSFVGTCVPKRDLPMFADLHRAGRFPVEKLLTHRITLDEINLGFERLADGTAVRQVVLF